MTSAFFGSLRILTSAVDVEVLERRDHRQAADEFGDQAELEQILGLGLAQHLADAALVGRGDMRAEADRLALQAVADDLLEARRRRRRR